LLSFFLELAFLIICFGTSADLRTSKPQFWVLKLFHPKAQLFAVLNFVCSTICVIGTASLAFLAPYDLKNGFESIPF